VLCRLSYRPVIPMPPEGLLLTCERVTPPPGSRVISFENATRPPA